MRPFTLFLLFVLSLPDPALALRNQSPAETGLEETLQLQLVQSLIQAGQVGRQWHQDNKEQWRAHLILSRWNIKRIAGLTQIPEPEEGVPPSLISELASKGGVVFASAAQRQAKLHALADEEPAGSAVVLGMGRGFDIPLLELALKYRSVVLVDLDEPSVRSALHELHRELTLGGFPEPRIQVIMKRVEIQFADLSGIADQSEQFVAAWESRKAALTKADAILQTIRFLDELKDKAASQPKPLKLTGTYDLAISSFVVSQIASTAVHYLEDAVTRNYGPLSREEWIQFQVVLQRFSARVAENHAGHIAQLLNPGGRCYFSSESRLKWPEQGVEAPLFPVEELLRAARDSGGLAVSPLHSWLWAQRMNGVFYPGAGYSVDAYQLARSGLEEWTFPEIWNDVFGLETQL